MSKGMELKMVVGLGNPGIKYAMTRHNVGFMGIDRILERFENVEITENVRYKLWEVKLDDKSFYVVKPFTYMNLSGVIFPEIVNKYSFKSENFLVIHDDVYIDLGRVKIKYDGSSGGHNGINSIVSFLETPNFWRLKIGIGPKRKDEDLVSFVLGEFEEEEFKILQNVLNTVPEIVRTILNHGYEKAMSLYNGMKVENVE